MRRSWVDRAPALRRLGRIRRAALEGALLGLIAGFVGGAVAGEGLAPYVVGVGASGVVLVGAAAKTVAYVLRE